jgi:tryptophan 2,3-dioxygenase
MEINEDIRQLLDKIDKKYKNDNQHADGYLQGLLYTEYLDYWHYVNLDALLALQHPKTNIKDEMVFIIYHQITELYFKLCLWEYDQILKAIDPTVDFLIVRLKRIINYFTNLTHSFGIMVDGMEQEQFLKFRMALLPASGFQSAQYRMIEMASTNLENLVNISVREKLKNASLEDKFSSIYWKSGATVAETGEKTLTLKRFEEKYGEAFINWAKKHENNNLQSLYHKLPDEKKQNKDLIAVYREVDRFVNVRWPLVHIKSAMRYLKPDSSATIAATGGTNWEKYLPPNLQFRIFFPELWSKEELENWGKSGS